MPAETDPTAPSFTSRLRDASHATDDDRKAARLAATAALRARRRSTQLEIQAVEAARGAGVSWDELGRWLDLPGETVRRRHSPEEGLEPRQG